MTSDQWRRARELFERAFDDEPSDIGAWLAREAPDEPDVRAEVASLLANHRRAGSFLTQPFAAVVTDSDEDASFEPGMTVGAYTIVREIGRGGMGRVYLATDARLGR